MLALICSLLHDDFYILMRFLFFVFLKKDQADCFRFQARLSICLHLCVISSVWYLDIVCLGLIFAGYISNWQCGIIMIFLTFPWGTIGWWASCYLSSSPGFYSVVTMFGARDAKGRSSVTSQYMRDCNRRYLTPWNCEPERKGKERRGCSRSVSMQRFPRNVEVHFIGDELIYKSL